MVSSFIHKKKIRWLSKRAYELNIPEDNFSDNIENGQPGVNQLRAFDKYYKLDQQKLDILMVEYKKDKSFFHENQTTLYKKLEQVKML